MLEGCIAWPAKFAQDYRAQGYWEDITLYEVLSRTADRLPDKIAVIDSERRVTYAELKDRVDLLAAGMLSLGLRRLDRVIFQLNNSLELVEAFFALVRIGVIPILALPAHRRTEIVHFARASGAVALLSPDSVRNFDYCAMALEIVAECPEVRTVIVSGKAGPGQVSLMDLRVRADESKSKTLCSLPRSEDVALMLLSGGTTGLPKLIPRTHADYIYGSTQSARVAGLGVDTVFLAMLPIAHNYTLGAPGVLGTIAFGGTTVIAPGTAADLVFPLIERERVSLICAAVPLVPKWLASDLFDRYDLSSLKVFMNGGAKLAPELRRRIEEKFCCIYQESFGTAEGLLNMTLLDDPEYLRMNSSGRPVSPADEIKIVDASGQELPDGQPGELLVRGPYTVRGYYNAPQINATAFTSDGFYRMGDLVKRIDGYLYLEGRIKDLVNRGGEKISCEEIENHILAHPKIESVCVVSMPDDVFGEKACAVAILREGCALSLEELLKFLKTRDIASFKMPERLEVVEEFPISPAGKVLRRDLRAIVAERLAGEQLLDPRSGSPY